MIFTVHMVDFAQYPGGKLFTVPVNDSPSCVEFAGVDFQCLPGTLRVLPGSWFHQDLPGGHTSCGQLTRHHHCPTQLVQSGQFLMTSARCRIYTAGKFG